MANRIIPEINAGSMADIAFLLLVYFLVTTTIQTDSGINVLLPPPPDGRIIVCGITNTFSVQINQYDQLLVRDKPKKMSELKTSVKDFILNPHQRLDWAESPKKAVVVLACDNGTSYNAYLTVYNELKAAYRELWEAKAKEMFGRKYESLSTENKKRIREEIPLVISEAEPSSFAG